MTERFAAVSRSNTFFYRPSRRPLLYPPSSNEQMLELNVDITPLPLFLCWEVQKWEVSISSERYKF